MPPPGSFKTPCLVATKLKVKNQKVSYKPKPFFIFVTNFSLITPFLPAPLGSIFTPSDQGAVLKRFPAFYLSDAKMFMARKGFHLNTTETRDWNVSVFLSAGKLKSK